MDTNIQSESSANQIIDTINLCEDNDHEDLEKNIASNEEKTTMTINENNSGSLSPVSVDITEDDVAEIVEAMGNNDEIFEVNNLDQTNIDASDYSKFDFMADLDVIDEYDGNPDNENDELESTTNRTDDEAEMSTGNVKKTINRYNEKSHDGDHESKKMNKKKKKRRSSSIKEASRRDPEKTRLAIEQDKIKTAKDKEKRLISDIVQTGLVPPGMELEHEPMGKMSGGENKDKSSTSSKYKKKPGRETKRKSSTDVASKSRDLDSGRRKTRKLSISGDDMSSRNRELLHNDFKESPGRDIRIYEPSPIRSIDRNMRMSPRRTLRRSREIVISPRRSPRNLRRSTRSSSRRRSLRISPRRSPRRNVRISPNRRSPRRSAIYSRRSRSRSPNARRSNHNEKYSPPNRRNRVWLNDEKYKSRSPHAQKRREEKIPFLQELAAKLNEVHSKADPVAIYQPNSFTYAVPPPYQPEPYIPTPPIPVPAPPPPQIQPVPTFYQPSAMPSMQQPPPQLIHQQQQQMPQSVEFHPPASGPPAIQQQFDPYDQSFFIGNQLPPSNEVYGSDLNRNNITSINLTDDLLHRTNTAMQSQVNSLPANKLEEKEKVIRRCEDALKLLNDKKYTGPFITTNSEPRESMKQEDTSPLLSKPIVRLPFTTFGMDLFTNKKFSSCCQRLLNRIGLESISSPCENDRSTEDNLCNTSNIFSQSYYQPIPHVSTKTINTQTDSELSSCKECTRRKAIRYADCGAQATNVKLTFSVGTQVTESDFYSVIPRNQSLASLTPAQLLGKPTRILDTFQPPEKHFDSNLNSRSRQLLDPGFPPGYNMLNNAPLKLPLMNPAPFIDNARSFPNPYPPPLLGPPFPSAPFNDHWNNIGHNKRF